MKDEVAIPTDRRALMAVFRAVQGLKRSMDREFEPMDLTGQQAGLLMRCASGSGGLTFEGLAKGLGTDSAGVTRLADRLEAKGLLERQASPGDRRATQLVLTKAGHELVPAVRRSFGRWRDRALKGVSDEEQERLIRILECVRANTDVEAQAERGVS